MTVFKKKCSNRAWQLKRLYKTGTTFDDEEEPLMRLKARSIRRRQEQRWASRARSTVVSTAGSHVTVSWQSSARGASHPLSVTLTSVGRDVAMVGSHQVLQPAPTMGI